MEYDKERHLNKLGDDLRKEYKEIIIDFILHDTKGRKILVQKRAMTRSLFPGAWEFPGGHLEPHETLVGCLKRLVFEEGQMYLNDIIDMVHLFTWDSDKDVVNLQFLVNATGNFTPNRDKISEHRLIDIDGLGPLFQAGKESPIYRGAFYAFEYLKMQDEDRVDMFQSILFFDQVVASFFAFTRCDDLPPKVTIGKENEKKFTLDKQNGLLSISPSFLRHYDKLGCASIVLHLIFHNYRQNILSYDDVTFMRMPACYKEETSLDLKHPDSKVKLAGGFKEFEDAYSAVEKLMTKLDITGWLYLEGILHEGRDGESTIKFIEGATRLSGNSPIEIGALKGFNFYSTLLRWIEDTSIGFAYENRLCIQHASFKHHGEVDVEKLLALDWILEARYEDLAKVPFSTDDRTRIRISFIGDTFDSAKERAKAIAKIVDNPEFALDIHRVLNSYGGSSLLYEPRKLSFGTWDENVSWEFYVSSQLPNPKLCTATFCLALQGNDKVVLTRTKRGWEMPGGHMEPGETLEEALFREAHEEGGYTPQQYKLFGYRKITCKKRPIPARADREYPFPVSYIPHFIAKSNVPLDIVHGEEDEVLESGAFALSELPDLNINEIAIIEAGLPFREKL